MSAQLCDVFGEWLSNFEWDYFGTFTFELPRKSSGIDPVARWWHRMAAACPSVEARAFIADEHHRDGERIHVHALLYSDPTAHQDYLWGSWRKHWGRERILKFDPQQGASFYCAKYLIKDQQDRASFRFVTWDEGTMCDGSDIDGCDMPTWYNLGA